MCWRYGWRHRAIISCIHLNECPQHVQRAKERDGCMRVVRVCICVCCDKEKRKPIQCIGMVFPIFNNIMHYIWSVTVVIVTLFGFSISPSNARHTMKSKKKCRLRDYDVTKENFMTVSEMKCWQYAEHGSWVIFWNGMKIFAFFFCFSWKSSSFFLGHWFSHKMKKYENIVNWMNKWMKVE